ncbi:MAG: LysR family transcriptional regulator [Steroidobacteraceae bacterium]
MRCWALLGSFAAAANELACMQSTVSQQIAEIERRIGVRVLNRRPVRPTEAGQVLLEAQLAVRASTAIALQEIDALSKARAGRVRLGASALQELPGWETERMVRRYAHLAADHLAVYAGNSQIHGTFLAYQLRLPKSPEENVLESVSRLVVTSPRTDIVLNSAGIRGE